MAETLSALVTSRLGGESRRQWCLRRDFPKRTLHDLEAGNVGTPRLGTVTQLVIALGFRVTRQTRARVAAAIEASRLAAATVE